MHDTIDPDARVIVAIITRPADLARARDEHWYRIPVRSAPRGLAADYIAFYQTAAFGTERWSVRCIAPIERVMVCSRRDLLPEEASHPRAAERYYRLALGPLASLPEPIPSRRLRRLTFIPTTYSHLLYAEDVADLWHTPPHAEDVIWGGGVGGRRRRA